ncbi:MAG TPA: SEC-C metal-binding domain-containing protein [Chitinophagales bacterium]|nr:SEC-C metal-binding domain-containing protein [Chitinophagales bacterium]
MIKIFKCINGHRLTVRDEITDDRVLVPKLITCPYCDAVAKVDWYDNTAVPDWEFFRPETFEEFKAAANVVMGNTFATDEMLQAAFENITDLSAPGSSKVMYRRIIYLQDAPNYCKFCGNQGYKTDGAAQVICRNRAYTGKCYKAAPYVRTEPKQGRNILCGCGSGKKYKNCCGK